MNVRRAYKFRLYPTEAQAAELSEWSRQLRRLWNVALEQRLMAFDRPKGERPRVDYFMQSREMTELLRVDDQLKRVMCCARQETLRDLDRAWQRCFKRLGGRPRFKRYTDAMRIYLSTPKHWRVEMGALHLSGVASSVGPLRLRQDRSWPRSATFTSCHIVCDVDQYFAVFPLGMSVDYDKPLGGAVGLNRGAVHAVADSYGRVVDSPRYYARGLRGIQALSRDLARKLPYRETVKPPEPRRTYSLEMQAIADRFGTSAGNVAYQIKRRGGVEQAVQYLQEHPPVRAQAQAEVASHGRNRERARLRLARAHRLIRRQREWFLHDVSAYYTKRYALIGIESWSTKKMTKSESDPKIESPKHLLNRKILDVGWYELERQLRYKADARGGRVVAVAPGLEPTISIVDKSQIGEAGISGTCSGCGAPLAESASGHAEAFCETCSCAVSGDVNAARNVLLRALRADAPAPKTPSASIQIKGRQRRSLAAAKPAADACGGDAPVRAPVEAGKSGREAGHPECTVEPSGCRGHQPMEHGD